MLIDCDGWITRRFLAEKRETEFSLCFFFRFAIVRSLASDCIWNAHEIGQTESRSRRFELPRDDRSTIATMLGFVV